MTAKPVTGALLAVFLIPATAVIAAVALIDSVLGAATTSCTTPTALAGTGDGGGFLATAYGPPWDAMNGTGITATGLDLTAAPAAFVIAVDPTVIPLRTYEHVTPNPFDTTQAFEAADTGDAITGHHIDIYDWRGRADQLAWGARQVTVTPAATPGTAAALNQITPTTPASTNQPAAGCPIATNEPLTLAPGDQAAILSDGLATAPSDAPTAVKQAIAARNLLTDTPYLWGGGHGTPLTELAAGYDCSGATSFILHAAGVLGAYALDSTGLESWGAPGPGRWITVYANSRHAFIDIAGVVMDTAWYAPVQPTTPPSGPRWQPESIIAPQYGGDLTAGNGGFIQRHPPGL
jgi:3D (Asp-Asp-Asp) domain-containing protein